MNYFKLIKWLKRQVTLYICWSWNSSTMATWCKELIHLKRPWCWERLRAGGGGDDSGWDGWMASLTQWTFGWTPGVGDGQGGLACCGSWGCKESVTSDWLKWVSEWPNVSPLFTTFQTKILQWLNNTYKIRSKLPRLKIKSLKIPSVGELWCNRNTQILLVEVYR